MGKKKMTAIIGIRVSPSLKMYLQEEATKKGNNLSEYLLRLIEAGREQGIDEPLNPQPVPSSSAESGEKELTNYKFREELKRAYPGVDLRIVEAQMGVFLSEHPSKKKSRKFILAWFRKWYGQPRQGQL